MAYQLTDLRSGDSVFTAFRHRLADLGQSIWRSIEAYGEVRGRTAQLEKMHAKSDAELAEMGLTRADIPMHVFRDLMFQ
ncbi:hypothetical protein EU805_14915 [Salipiger sp. IMCC34102]|uniref:hypothetical protein n=1 Tax=Salipiger sp. IMCC34102 TaxID=2510647 RepID=UPI00101D7AFF|nr:hypothetical protein [Salipiger sp. IMCC34102]RYH01272.1 hypothetical protein EU805_14915 [Salipiger sp. IMCC34102]